MDHGEETRMTYNEKPSLPPGGEWLLELARKLWGDEDDE